MTTQQGSHAYYDVLVIGSGLSGLCYCLQLTKLQPTLKIALISKTALNESNSYYAQGGIAAVSLKEDSIESHIDDTLKAGDGLCYRSAVEFLINQGPYAIQELINHGVLFDKQDDSNFQLAKEGGHAYRRIYHHGDTTGKHLISTLLSKLSETSNIECLDNHTAVNLITHYLPHRTDTQGEVLGAYVLNNCNNKIDCLLANCTILATGGAGKTYRFTTNPMVATGDGVAMAYRSGARVGNMEFYQFHPTLLHHPTINNFLISEAVRGEGAKLLNGDTKKQFMQHYAPQQMELATRDVVARAIFNEIEHSDTDFVYLDISHHSQDYLSKRFPKIVATLQSIGINMSKDLIPVVPAAHYQCGGVLTDIDGRTDLKRLYAIGEVAFTGFHGANRLASNSLLEAVASASNAAIASTKDSSQQLKLTKDIPSWSSPAKINPRRASQINAHWRGLRGEMTSYAGIVRTDAGLSDLLKLIRRRKKIIEEYYWNHLITRDFIELRNIVLNAELIVRSALARRESRGGHFREDYPTRLNDSNESIINLSLSDSF